MFAMMRRLQWYAVFPSLLLLTEVSMVDCAPNLCLVQTWRRMSWCYWRLSMVRAQLLRFPHLPPARQDLANFLHLVQAQALHGALHDSWASLLRIHLAIDSAVHSHVRLPPQSYASCEASWARLQCSRRTGQKIVINDDELPEFSGTYPLNATRLRIYVETKIFQFGYTQAYKTQS